MRNWKWLAVVVLVAMPAVAGDQVVRCGQLFDAASGTLRAKVDVTVRGSEIVGVAAAGRGRADVDLSGLYCLPGLIDAHVHLTGEPTMGVYAGLTTSVPRQALIGVKNARTTLEAGFTTVRNVGAQGYSDVALRDAIEAGDVAGPRMVVSGPAIGITGGHCDENLLAPQFGHVAEGVADGPWAARAKVREVIKYGADVIKICASGGVLSKGDEAGAAQYTAEEMTAIVGEAHKLGRRVAAHAHGTQSIKDAIRAGVDSVEHCSLIDEEGIRMAKAAGTFLVFDIYNDTYILEMGAKNGLLPEMLEKERQVGKLQRENFRKAYQGGARMVFGSDAAVYPHGDNWKQFPVMVEYGMPLSEALRAATVTAAELLGRKGRLGEVKAGAVADLIAVEADPTKDINALREVRFVMKDGRVVKGGARPPQ